ncbi:hypothetical protein Q9L58_004888 [Maublancomyces gigas]|uniref:histone acetyltransferase n=1 Tax=Discina gigas TaxID=1032678 RepID=A0ABR3GJJ8_9PEZI
MSTPITKTASLFSAPPGKRPPTTTLESHFLTVSYDHVLVFAIEVLIYTTARSSARTFFISKADSSGYLPSSLSSFITASGSRQSTLRTIATTFIQHLFNVFRNIDPSINATISLFARSQTQYLFPNSAQNDKKHVLTDRGLICWWCKILDPILQEHSGGGAKGFLLVPGFESLETRQLFPPATASTLTKWVQGHPYKLDPAADITVREVIPHFPDDPKSRFLDELGNDEKGRTGKVLARGQGWRNCRTIEQFWELMSFRQECSLGRCVGFLWVVLDGEEKGKAEKKIKTMKKIPLLTSDNSGLQPTVSEKEAEKEPEKSAQETPENSQLPQPEAKRGDEAETEKPPFAPSNSQPDPTPTTEPPLSPETAATPPTLTRSPTVSPRKSNKRPSSSTAPGSPQKKIRTVNPIPLISDSPAQSLLLLDEKAYQRVSDSLLNHADFGDPDNARRSSAKWLEGAAIAGGRGGQGSWGVEVKGKIVVGAEGVAGVSEIVTPTINVLTVRKKPKPEVVQKEKDFQGREVNVLPASLFRKKPKSPDAAEIKPGKGVTEKLKTTEEAREEVDRQGRIVNVLDSGLIKRKGKPQEV